MKKKEKRFEVLHEESINMGVAARVIRDKVTGVQYLYSSSGYGGGLTALLDKDGKPIIDEISE